MQLKISLLYIIIIIIAQNQSDNLQSEIHQDVSQKSAIWETKWRKFQFWPCNYVITCRSNGKTDRSSEKQISFRIIWSCMFDFLVSNFFESLFLYTVRSLSMRMKNCYQSPKSFLFLQAVWSSYYLKKEITMWRKFCEGMDWSENGENGRNWRQPSDTVIFFFTFDYWSSRAVPIGICSQVTVLSGVSGFIAVCRKRVSDRVITTNSVQTPAKKTTGTMKIWKWFLVSSLIIIKEKRCS